MQRLRSSGRGACAAFDRLSLTSITSTIAVDRVPELEYSIYGLWPGIESAEALDHYSPPQIRHVRLSASLAQGEVQLTGHLVPFRAPLRVAPHRQYPITGMILLSASAHDEAESGKTLQSSSPAKVATSEWRRARPPAGQCQTLCHEWTVTSLWSSHAEAYAGKMTTCIIPLRPRLD